MSGDEQREAAIEKLASKVTAKAFNHPAKCHCNDCENVKYGVRWGYREAYDAASRHYDARIEALETALRHYADEGTWTPDGVVYKPGRGRKDGWVVAREALIPDGQTSEDK